MITQSLFRSIRLLTTAAPLLVAGIGNGGRLEAQNFTPPETEEQESPAAGGVNFGLYGFSTRFGLDFEGDAQAVLSIALDVGDLLTNQLRLRPSAEIGFGNDSDTYVVNAEVMYRFTADTERAVPYVGAGVGVAGQDNCRFAPNCPDAWFQFALGFELQIRDYLNWLLEYHAEDALDRHRLFIGLSTRRGG